MSKQLPDKALTLSFPQTGAPKEFRWVFMPYAIQPMGKDRWIVLNRSYKPVGMHTRAYIDYEPFALTMKLQKRSLPHLDHRSAEKLAQLEWPHDIYLYDDGCVPTRSSGDMKRYLERVEHLMAMQVRGEGK